MPVFSKKNGHDGASVLFLKRDFFWLQLREAQTKLEEYETANLHLQKRLDKLKNARSTLFKELSSTPEDG